MQVATLRLLMTHDTMRISIPNIRRRVVSSGKMALLSIMLSLVLPHASHATVLIDDDFEASTPEALGYYYAQGACLPAGQATRTMPCPYNDVSTDLAHHGSQSLKMVFDSSQYPDNNAIHSQAIVKNFPATTNLYTRYYLYLSNFTPWHVVTKRIYYHCCGITGGTGHLFGSREIAFAIQGTEGPCPIPGQVVTCMYYPNVASVPLNNGHWYCVEEHFNLGTPGVANGQMELWIDGVQTLNYPNQYFMNVGNTSAFSELELYRQDGDGVTYMDQFAAGTTRIGCAGGSTDTTPPTAPTELATK